MTKLSDRRLQLIVLAAFGTASGLALAAEDFTRLSNEELIQRRAEVRNMSEDDRTRFREEMQTRARDMTPEERNRAGFGRGVDDGPVGDEARMRQRTGADNEHGHGEQHRERTRTEAGSGGYGQGYEARQRGMSGGGDAMGRGGMGGGRGGRGR